MVMSFIKLGLVFIVDTSGLETKRLLQNECAKWPKALKPYCLSFPLQNQLEWDSISHKSPTVVTNMLHPHYSS